MSSVLKSTASTARISRRDFVAGLSGGLGLVARGIGVREKSVGGGRPVRQNSASRTFHFAGAFPPRVEQLFPTDRWLKSISEAGYTHLFLIVDPFYHPEADFGSEEDGSMWLLSLFAMTTGPVHRSYQSWLRAISDAAGGFGLQVGIELWEPQLPIYARQTLPPEWKGPALHDGSEPLCVLQPDARAWLLQGFRDLLDAVPNMNAIAMGAFDNGANLCDSKCPRCGSHPLAERFSDLYRDIESACKHVRPNFQLIPYDWFWPDDFFAPVLTKLPHGTPILTRMEKGASYTPDPSHPEWAGHVFDESVGCDEPGPGLQKAKGSVASSGGGVLAMLPLSGMFEAWNLPYIPAAGQIAKKFDLMRREKVSGWVDYDCGGIHRGLMLDLVTIVQNHPIASSNDWLRILAEQRYGSTEGAAVGLQMWQAFDGAVRAFPLVLDFNSISEFSGRFGVAMGLVPIHPFLPDRARQAKDARQERFWFDPHNFLTAEAIPPIRECMSRTLQSARKGLSLSEQLLQQAAPTSKPNAGFDASMAELTFLAWSSMANFYAWAAAVQGDKSVPVADVIKNEIQVTQRYWQLASRPDLEVGNMVWQAQRELAQSLPEASGEFQHFEKMAGCNVASRQLANAGNYQSWKIAGLEEQLKALTA